MKNYLIVCLFTLFAFPALVHGEEAKSLNIAVVDVQQLMANSKAAQSIQSQGKDLLKTYEKDMSKMEKELKDAEKKVMDARKDKDEEEFKKQFKAFQEKLKDSQRKAQEIRAKNDQAVAKALNVLQEEIVDIVDDMTAKNGYDMVITRADIITVSKDIDITADVMERLNKNLKTVKVR